MSFCFIILCVTIWYKDIKSTIYLSTIRTRDCHKFLHVEARFKYAKRVWDKNVTTSTYKQTLKPLFWQEKVLEYKHIDAAEGENSNNVIIDKVKKYI